jgi:hypothetical protein
MRFVTKTLAALALGLVVVSFAQPAHAVLDFKAFNKAIKAKDKEGVLKGICDKGQLCRQLNGLACQNQSFFSFCMLACETKFANAGFKKEWASSKCAAEEKKAGTGYDWSTGKYKDGKGPKEQISSAVASKASKNAKVAKVMGEVCKNLIIPAKDLVGPNASVLEAACAGNADN